MINDESRQKLKEYWKGLSAKQIRSGIEETLTNLLDGSDNKTLKIELLQKNVLNDQKVKRLENKDWLDVLDEIVGNIYKYINTDSSEGQDTSSFISDIKKELLENNTLDAVFTLPNEIFYPGASASACCMVFTFGKSHVNADGTVNKTFFGYYKEDGHKKKKNLGRIEQFDKDNNSIWKQIEEKWLDLYRNKTVEDGMSAMQAVSGDDEWLCEAYMKTDYSTLCAADFQKTLNNYLAYQMKEGKIYES